MMRRRDWFELVGWAAFLGAYATALLMGWFL